MSIARSVKCSMEKCSDFISNGPNKLKIAVQNIRSIYKNLDGFQAAVSTLNVDVLIFNECQLSLSKNIPQMTMMFSKLKTY